MKDKIVKNKSSIFAISLMALLSGCASIVNGTSQTLSVSTVSTNGNPISKANCDLTNDKGNWYVVTPGTVTVHRSYGALSVKCKKNGYQDGLVSSSSSTKSMAFGNILFGGVIGAGVDISDGAAYHYPNMITVPMSPVPVQKTSQAAQPNS